MLGIFLSWDLMGVPLLQMSVPEPSDRSLVNKCTYFLSWDLINWVIAGQVVPFDKVTDEQLA